MKAGILGAMNLSSTRVASVAPAIASAVRLVEPSAETRLATCSMMEWPRAAVTPSASLSWLTMISSAAAAVKPIITECEMKLTKRPRRSAPKAHCSSPTSSVRKIALAT